MALPHTIADGQFPKGDYLQDNFVYLLGLISGGEAIKSDTFANLKAAALAAPTVPFVCIPTDLDAFLLYCGKSDRGPGADGFITILSFEAIT